MSFSYRGVHTRTLYVRDTPLLDAQGNLAVVTTYNGETVVQANRDGSVARGTAGPTPLDDIYSPGYTPSPWEEQT